MVASQLALRRTRQPPHLSQSDSSVAHQQYSYEKDLHTLMRICDQLGPEQIANIGGFNCQEYEEFLRAIRRINAQLVKHPQIDDACTPPGLSNF